MTKRMAESTHVHMLLRFQLFRRRLGELPLMVTWRMLSLEDTMRFELRNRNLKRRLTKTLAAASFFLWSVGSGQCLQTSMVSANNTQLNSSPYY